MNLKTIAEMLFNIQSSKITSLNWARTPEPHTRYKDTRHGQAGEAATFCRPKYKYLARNQCTQQSATGESASELPLAELRALIALRTNLVSHSSYLFIWYGPTIMFILRKNIIQLYRNVSTSETNNT